MFQYTLNNHFRWGWDHNKWFNNQSQESQTLRVGVGACKREYSSFREECIIAADTISQQTQRRLYVMWDSSLDTQVICFSMLEAQLDFTICIPSMGNNLNVDDVQQAKKFCEKFKLRYLLFKIHMPTFFKEFCAPIIKQYSFVTSQELMNLWVQEQVRLEHGGFFVSGKLMELNRYPIGIDGTTYSECSWKIPSSPIQQYFIDREENAISNFFLYTPELIASFIMSKELLSFVNSQELIYTPNLIPVDGYNKIFEYCLKPLFLKNHWPELIPMFDKSKDILNDQDTSFAMVSEFYLQKPKFKQDKTVYIDYSEMKEHFESSQTMTVWHSNSGDREQTLESVFDSILNITEDDLMLDNNTDL